jgi:hypothetical protein
VEVPSGRIEKVYGEGRHFEAPNWSPDEPFFVVNSGGRLYRLPARGDKRLEEIPTGFATRVNNDHGISPAGRSLALSHHADEYITDPAQDWLASSIYIVPIAGGPAPVKVTSKERGDLQDIGHRAPVGPDGVPSASDHGGCLTAVRPPVLASGLLEAGVLRSSPSHRRSLGR